MFLQMMEKIGLTQEELDKIRSHIDIRRVSANEIFLAQGDCEDATYFVESGLVKLFYLTSDGDEFIKSFIIQGETFASLVSYTNAEGSIFSAKALEDSVLIRLPRKVLDELMNSSLFVRFSFDMLMRVVIKKEKREHDLLSLTDEERYSKFMREQTDLAQRISQADLAKYLGITSVGISRIKKRVEKKEKP